MERKLLAFALILGISACYDMGYEEKYGVVGLATSPNPKQLREGALLQARNIAVRRPGMAEPRPGIEAAQNPFSGGFYALKMLPFAGDVVHVGLADGEEGQDTRWSDDSAILDEDGNDIQWDFDRVFGAEVRKNFYVTTKDAVRKIAAAEDLEAPLAGLLPPFLRTQGSVSYTGGPYASGTQAAYRVTISRKDANALEVTSAPSGRAILAVATGPDAGVLIVYLSAEHVAGDTLRVYRSAVVSNTLPAPSDDLRLVLEYVLTSADITAGSVTLGDAVVDYDRGAALYTNPAREGIERQNVPPPRARDLALFKGSLFAADIQYPPSLTFAFSPGSNPNIYAKNITRTNGSADIVVDSNTNLRVGMLLTARASWSGTAPVRITAIAGTTITMSETWTGLTDGAPVAVFFADSLRIKVGAEDQYYFASSSLGLFQSVNTGALTATSGVLPSAHVRVYAVNDMMQTTDSGTDVEVGARRTVEIRGILPTTSVFEVWATHGEVYEPALPAPDATDGLAASQDVFPHGLAWSKDQEPEHFMLRRYLLVGNQRAPIVRIIPTQDALWIFKGKGDGIYRLSGFGERSGWRVDPVDASTYLLHPELALAYRDTVYGWTDKGLVPVNEAGTGAPLNVPIADLTRPYEATVDANAIVGAGSGQPRAFSFANGIDAELVFGLPGVDALAPVDRVYVLNLRTNAWTEWDVGDVVAAAFDPATSLPRYSLHLDTVVRSERESDDPFRFADEGYAANITAIDGAEITVSIGGSLVPEVGDALAIGENWALVTAVNGATVTVDTPEVLEVSVAAVLYRGIASVIQWHPHAKPAPAVKRFRDLVIHWDDVQGMLTWDVVLSTTASGDEQTVSDEFESRAVLERPQDTRILMNQETAFAAQLFTTLEIRQAGAQWRVGGISLNADAVSGRVRR